MKGSFFLFFIIGGISLSLITFAVLTYIKSTPKTDPSNATKQLTTDVLAIMQTSEDKNKQAQELLSKNPTEKDQIKAKQLLKESLADAIKATEIQPNNPATWYFLSQQYKQIIEVNPKVEPYAENALKKSIQLSPDNSKLYQELATIYIFAKKYEEAKDVLQKAIELDPKDANPYFKLGNIYKETGEETLARQFYLEAKKLTPKDSAANNAMIDHQLKSLDK